MTAFDPGVAQRLGATCRLAELRLLAIRHELVGDEPEANASVPLQLAVDTQASAEPGRCRFVTELRIHAMGSTGRPFLLSEQRFLVEYTTAQDVSASELETFAQSQLLVHVWPHARTHLQLGTGILGVRPLLLPSLRVTEAGARLEAPGAEAMALVPTVRVGGV